jgi:hypothetical protein
MSPGRFVRGRTPEMWKHLRPYNKRRFWKRERSAIQRVLRRPYARP